MRINKTRMHRILKWIWVFPGIPVSFMFRQSITYLTFLSVYAIITSHWAAEEAAPDPDESA